MKWFQIDKWKDSNRLKLGFGVAGICFLVGFFISWLAVSGILPNLIFVSNYRMDVAGISSRLGILLGVFTLVVAGGSELWRQKCDQFQQHECKIQNESRQRFLQRLDHELKNPLTIIRLGIVNMRQEKLNSEQERSLMRIDEQVRRMQKLVTDLRLLTELDESRIEYKPFELTDVLQEAISLACDAAGEREVNLTVQDTPWPLSSVQGDRDLLVLAFRNLLDNALKFTQASDRVAVRAVEDIKSVVVEVADTGMGIPPDEIGQVFEELYRGRNARSIPGSGLGLRLVQRIVFLHGGEVDVRSRAGKGTVFTVRLPLG